MKIFAKTRHKPEWIKQYKNQPVTLFRRAWIWSKSEESLYRKFCVGSTLHLCSGYSDLGDCKIDINRDCSPDVLCDVHYLPFKDLSFDTIIIDPPWHGPKSWMMLERMIEEIVRIARKRVVMILGNLFYLLPRPFKLKEVYIIKKISPQIKHVYVWERTSGILSDY